MHTVLIVIHLFIAAGLVGVILLQRSEGGALGMGGGGPGGLMSGRAAGNVLTRATTALGVAFFVTSIGLTILSRATADGVSIIDTTDPDAILQSLSPPEDPAEPLIPEPEEPAVPLDE